MPFTSILFPVDFSARSHAIVPHVRAIRDRFNASLTLLHLVEVPALAYAGAEGAVFDFPINEMREVAQKQLDQFAASEFPGCAVKTIVDEGDPGTTIAEVARDLKADLIMLPTRGRGAFRSALLGSTTAKTLHDATCAVWTEAHCEKAGAAHLQWQNITCAIDTVPEGLALIRYADGFAKNYGAKVRLAHAVPGADAGAGKYFDAEFASGLEDIARESIAGMQKEAGTNFEVCVGAGSIPDVIRRSALGHNADLVLIGRGALTHFAGRLRSHTCAIVREMPCPVLSI